MVGQNRLRVVLNEEIPHLAKMAEKFLPQSDTIYGFLTVGFKYKSTTAVQSKIYVPEKEDSSFFIAITGLYGKSTISSLAVFWQVHSIPKSIIAGYLSDLPELSSKRPVLFGCCDEDVLQELHQILQEEAICGHMLERYQDDKGFLLRNEDHTILPTLTLPPSYYLEEIHPDDTEIVFGKFEHDVESVENLELMIKKLPSSAVFYYPEDGSPKVMASWCLSRHDGLIGFTHTLSAFRRKKLATIVTSDLAKKQLKLGYYMPRVVIMTHNTKSLELHHKMGFIKVSAIGWHYYKQLVNP